MTDSYILYLQTDLSVETVLEIIFEPKSISPIAGTDMLYARGSVYLAHAQRLPEQIRDSHSNLFNFSPTINIRYFPDGVSSVKTAMSILVEGIMRWFQHNNQNLLLSANNKVTVIQRQNGIISINTRHGFWQADRLSKIDLPYKEISF